MRNITKGARADYLATHPKEAAVQKATIETICGRIGKFRKDAENWGKQTVKLANDARAIGIFIKEFLDALPGKQMTLDFWQQFDAMFIDQFGHKITLETLRIFVRISDNSPDEIDNVQIAMSWRQPLLLAAGFELESDRPTGTAHAANFYNKFFQVLDVKRLDNVIVGLESDPEYGDIDQWPSDRRERVWLQIKPMVERVKGLEAKLNPVKV